jgi:CRISPR-associated endoribonuclease Cas6/Csy4 subtype I-F
MTHTIDNLSFSDIRANAEEACDNQNLIQKVVSMLHGHNRHHPETLLGIDFPLWAPGELTGDLRFLRIFGERTALDSFTAQPQYRRLSTGGLTTSAAKAVPTSSAFIAMRRNNNADKQKPAHARRREKRGNAPWAGKQAPLGGFVKQHSTSTGEPFNLKMRKVSLPVTDMVQFSSYGLCLKGGVPSF